MISINNACVNSSSSLSIIYKININEILTYCFKNFDVSLIILLDMYYFSLSTWFLIFLTVRKIITYLEKAAILSEQIFLARYGQKFLSKQLDVILQWQWEDLMLAAQYIDDSFNKAGNSVVICQKN